MEATKRRRRPRRRESYAELVAALEAAGGAVSDGDARRLRRAWERSTPDERGAAVAATAGLAADARRAVALEAVKVARAKRDGLLERLRATALGG